MSRTSRILLCALLAATAGLIAIHNDNAEASEQPIGLWLPWEAGTSWRLTNGPHSSSSDGFGAALDFQPPDAAGKGCETNFVSSYWVVASAGGKVINQPNGLEIDHGNGFRTGYLHLAEKQMTSGRVDAGDRLGKASCCPEGDSSFCWATAPHLHFYTVYRGAHQGIRGINLEGWGVQESGCLARGGESVCVGGWLKSSAPPSAPSNADVVLILDATGDTNTGDPQRARLAAARAYLGESEPDDRVGIVTYNSVVHGTTHLRAAKGKRGTNAALLHRIDSVGADGRADLRVGLRAGCRELAQHGEAETRAAVLISDGVHDYRQLGQPQQCLKQHEWPLYTVAVAPGGEETLRHIAEDTGGQVINLTGVQDIGCEMHKLRMMISGQEAGACKTEPAFVEKTTRIDFEVPAGQAEATFAAMWLRPDVPSNVSRKARVAMSLVSPSGRSIGPETTRGDVSIEARTTSASYALVSPEAGVWSVRLVGAEVPPEGVPVTVSAQTTVSRPAPPPAEQPPADAATPGPDDAPPDGTPTVTPTPPAGSTPEPSQTATPDPSATPTPEPTPTTEPTPTQAPTPPPEPAPEPTPPP